jgi:TolB protein
MIENSKFEIRNSKLKIILSLLCLLIFILYPSYNCESKIYIDITSPAFKQLPIAIQEFQGPFGKDISDIIENDLEFTGFFLPVNRAAFVENPSQQFHPKNWRPLGIEAVVKGTVKEDNELSVKISLYDVYEGREVFRKEYKAARDLMRPLSHAIADDIYFKLTGEKGMFRSRIAFVSKDQDRMGIYIMDWDGKRNTKMGISGNIILPPRWSIDGMKLIYSAERNRQWGIYLLDFLNMSEQKIHAGKGTNMAGNFFPDSNDFCFSSSRDGTPDLYVKHIKDNKVTKISSSYGIDVSPAVSPDGHFIAFVSDRGGSPQIYIMNRDGSNIRRLTFEGSYNTSPSWSPKGDRIVFVGQRGRNQIFTIKPDRTELTQLTVSGNNEDPSFSPDGRFVAFSSDRDGMKGIYIMRANGESQRRISPKRLTASGPSWSPN